ncbi:DUF2279 domain-containing protein [Fluviicola sp.]|uniref:DUF2279 domain-containing protein n=1 Tax=Fluviicola sp. TaxID=1917219 RepID=UPI002822DB9D|nr:DUF2279 domain-containing protein [Fluviicola sp.]MDR0802061.1 YfiM family protein [Fluviicola sp.]
MKVFLLCLFFVASGSFAQQDSSWNKRSYWVAGTSMAVGGGSVALLSAIWYKEYPKSNFHFFNDSKEWLYMDKCGHAFTAYRLSVMEYSAWHWARMPCKKAIWLSGGIAWTYQLSVEILDGFSAEWGFSVADLTANTVGTALFIGQQLGWNEQRIQLKFGYKPSPYAKIRPDALGANFPQRLLKDYNAQSYWLCVAPGTFFRESRFPKWIQVGIGYSIDAKLHGYNNTYTDISTGKTYYAKQEYAISLDIDWAQIPVKKPWIRKVLKPLNTIKIPFPAIFWRNGVCYFGMF